MYVVSHTTQNDIIKTDLQMLCTLRQDCNKTEAAKPARAGNWLNQSGSQRRQGGKHNVTVAEEMVDVIEYLSGLN